MNALLTKYRRGMQTLRKSAVDFDFMYELFDIENADTVTKELSNMSLESEDEKSICEEDPDPDPEYIPESELDSSGEYGVVTIPKDLKNFNIERVCAIADRRNISQRDAALIISTTLQEVGVISNKNRKLIVDRSKVQRSQKKSRAKAVARIETTPIISFQFDGKLVHNLRAVEKIDGDGRVTKIKKNDKLIENIVIVKQPGDILLGFLACPSSSAADIFEQFKLFFAKKKISLDSLLAIGCDGAGVNTGNSNGVIAKFEEHLNRTLHWVVCLLHTNERTLGNIIKIIDGKTTGPTTHSGVIMKSIYSVHTKPPVKFEPVTFGNLPSRMECEKLTKDQKYLYKMGQIVDTGVVDAEFCKLIPGPINNARWMTSASRLLREYVGNESPSSNL